jgi:hypothetical protein
VIDILFWLCGLAFGWALHERDWRRAYIAENERLLKLLGEKRS